jgi:hypothetical protein
MRGRIQFGGKKAGQVRFCFTRGKKAGRRKRDGCAFASLSERPRRGTCDARAQVKYIAAGGHSSGGLFRRRCRRPRPMVFEPAQRVSEVGRVVGDSDTVKGRRELRDRLTQRLAFRCEYSPLTRAESSFVAIVQVRNRDTVRKVMPGQAARTSCNRRNDSVSVQTVVTVDAHGGITDDNLWRPTRRGQGYYTKDKLSTRRGAVHSIGWLCRYSGQRNSNAFWLPGSNHSSAASL